MYSTFSFAKTYRAVFIYLFIIAYLEKNDNKIETE